MSFSVHVPGTSSPAGDIDMPEASGVSGSRHESAPVRDPGQQAAAIELPEPDSSWVDKTIAPLERTSWLYISDGYYALSGDWSVV